MKLAQVVVYEADGELTNLLRHEAEKEGWRVRVIHNLRALPELLWEGVSVLILKLGTGLPAEVMGKLEQVRWLFPELPVVLVGNFPQPELETFSWELGATCCVFPPTSVRQHLLELVRTCLSAEKR